MQKLLLFLVTLALAHLATFTPPTSAQGGWDTVKQPQLGLTYKMARDYHPIPVDPLEKFIKLIYEEDVARNKKQRKQLLPRLEIIVIDHSLGAAAPTTGNEDDDGASSEEDEEPADDEADSDEPPPINSLERYVEQESHGWELGVATEQKDRDGYTYTQYEYLPKKTKWRGVVYAFSNAPRTVLFIGYCHDDDMKEEKKIWDGIIKKLRLADPDTSKLDKESQKQLELYRKKGYLDPEFRVKARSTLPKGWKSEDTENYILVFDTKDQPLLRLIERELEAIRKEYEKLFPPLEPVTAVSRVRICKDEQEYRSYGGPRGSGGYWNWMAEELVFFDYENVDGEAGTGKANSRIVLYHEAFHQFIFYSSGSFSPHSWFNEGTGDYFSGAKISGGKVKKIGVNPWRIQTIQTMIERKMTAPWKDMIRWSQSEYYGRNSEGLSGGACYAQGWSMIYFLRESKVAKKHEVWSTILDNYFDTLRETYNEGKAALVEEGRGDDEDAMNRMEQEAREKAIDVAFEDVDFDEIEEAWMDYIMKLKVPK
jgi:hypothetical protein